MRNSSNKKFQRNLLFGQKWESAVSEWLQENQNFVFNAYEYTPIEDGVRKAPKLHISPSSESLIAPDLQVAKDGFTHWVEVKSKSNCAYPFSKRGNWHYRTTGIDIKHWDSYWKVQEVGGIEVVIFFVHEDTREIRAASLDRLNNSCRQYIHNPSNKVYWCYDDLALIAEIDEDDRIIGI